MEEVDVLVVGAGPTGLMMAIELARHGLHCKIIDELPLPSSQSKALVLQARTLEILDFIGLIDPFLQEGLFLKALNPFSCGTKLARVPLDLIPSSYPTILSIEQSKTEKILSTHLEKLNVYVEREQQLIDLSSKEGIVYATISHLPTQKQKTIAASWVIGCDGAHSLVRKEVGLQFEGNALPQLFSLADVTLSWDYPHEEFFFFFEKRGPLLAIPLPESNRYRLIFLLDRCQGLSSTEIASVSPPSLEEVSSLLSLHAHQNIEVTDPKWMTHFRIHTRIVRHYSKGRLFLAGDAAHIHSPIGGQGMNTGLQDAFNLAWKLSRAHKNKASSLLLTTYSLERRAVGKTLLKITEKMSLLAFCHRPLWIKWRAFFLHLILSKKRGQQFLTQILSQTTICYPKSRLTWKSFFSLKKPKTGTRAPDGPLVFSGKKTTLQEIWRRKTGFCILLFTGPTPSLEDLKYLFQWGDRLRIHLPFEEEFLLITPILPERMELSLPFAIDPQGKTHQIYGFAKKGVCLLRPDRYIGYQTYDLDEKKILSYFDF